MLVVPAVVVMAAVVDFLVLNDDIIRELVVMGQGWAMTGEVVVVVDDDLDHGVFSTHPPEP